LGAYSIPSETGLLIPSVYINYVCCFLKSCLTYIRLRCINYRYMGEAKILDPVRELLPLTPAVFYILFALAEGEKHGYAIMKEVETVSGGQFTMGPGTLYTTIQRLLQVALIEETSTPSDSERRRRYYRLSRSGRQAFEAELNRMESLVRSAQRRKLVPRGAR
jgi:DNA-binding PadR family transcriptional regulator